MKLNSGGIMRMRRQSDVKVMSKRSPILAGIIFGTVSMVSTVQAITLERVANIRALSTKSAGQINIQDREIYSPKSALFSAAGDKIYVNSLEGHQTVVYSWPDLKKLNTIRHTFTEALSPLFYKEDTVFNYRYFQRVQNVNVFQGKPVEMTLSHGGRYLWVTYYRRSFDRSAQSPSAVAIIDTRTDKILRMMPTGPIPKYVAVSPDNRYVAITHWGDNTIGLIDTSSGNPWDFKYVAHLTVEHQLTQADKAGTNRDATCGLCLRGTVFSKDSKYLFVARMSDRNPSPVGQRQLFGGGIAGFHVPSRKYLGSVMSLPPTPRHLALTPDGDELLVTSNSSGFVSKKSVSRLIRDLEMANGERVRALGWKSVFVGHGARTIEVSPDGKYAYAALNRSVSVAAIDVAAMRVVSKISTDKFPVGLAVSRDGSSVVVTCQGIRGEGGNAVNIIRVAGYTPTRDIRDTPAHRDAIETREETREEQREERREMPREERREEVPAKAVEPATPPRAQVKDGFSLFRSLMQGWR